MASARTNETTTIRIRRQTLEQLKALAEQHDVPLTVMLDQVIERYRRDDILRRTNEAYAELKKDPDAWTELMRERAELEGTLRDGLEESY